MSSQQNPLEFDGVVLDGRSHVVTQLHGKYLKPTSYSYYKQYRELI